jgi:hypothetical protein
MRQLFKIVHKDTLVICMQENQCGSGSIDLEEKKQKQKVSVINDNYYYYLSPAPLITFNKLMKEVCL